MVLSEQKVVWMAVVVVVSRKHRPGYYRLSTERLLSERKAAPEQIVTEWTLFLPNHSKKKDNISTSSTTTGRNSRAQLVANCTTGPLVNITNIKKNERQHKWWSLASGYTWTNQEKYKDSWKGWENGLIESKLIITVVILAVGYGKQRGASEGKKRGQLQRGKHSVMPSWLHCTCTKERNIPKCWNLKLWCAGAAVSKSTKSQADNWNCVASRQWIERVLLLEWPKLWWYKGWCSAGELWNSAREANRD